MAKLPAMPAYTDAYLADTTDLTTEEHGAYWLMLLAAWRAPDCSLPDDDVRLARTTRMSKQRWQARMRPVMERFWNIANGQWTQKKQLQIRKQVEQNVEQKSAAGKASALKNKETTSTAVVEPYQQPKPKKKEKKDTSNEVCKEKTESPPKTSTKLKTACPENFGPTPATREVLNGEGHDDDAIDRELTKFVDDAGANGRKYSNWQAAFRNRFRSRFYENGADNAGTQAGHSSGSRQRADDKDRAAMRVLARRDQGGEL